MSINLVAVNLTSATVGTTGKVSLPLPTVQVDELAHLRVYNESGCGLTILFDNGHQEVIPAGAWPMFEIEPAVKSFTWTVTYVLPNAPVAQVSAVYYFPYEGVPPTPALGNSPIGVTGGVTTSSVQSLSNETAIPDTKIIDIGTLTIADLLDIFNDHFIWSVQQGSVAHQVLKGQTAGNPLQIGQAGDISEVLGNLTVDQASTLTGIITAAAANVFGAVGVLTHILGTLTVDQTSLLTGNVTLGGSLVTAAAGILAKAATDLVLNVDTGQTITFRINGGNIVTLNATAFTLLGSIVAQIGGKKINDASANNLMDWTAGGVFLKGNPSTSGPFHYQADGTNTDVQISAVSVVSFSTVNGTTAALNHNLKVAGVGVTPDAIVANAFNTGVNASNVTVGISEVGTTTFKATSIAAVAMKAICVKF